MKCPKCAGEMAPVKFAGQEVLRCGGCAAMWFAEFQLADLEDAKDAAALDTGDAAKGKETNKIDRIVCPQCKALMIRMVHIEQPHIWYEHCTVCGGSILDAGEFRDLTKETFGDFFKGLFKPERV